ncbi:MULTISPECIES: glycosyltransferase family 4 protein [Paraburkholderia]|uniref:glycosyltransferase family 4 protein n=1 Tax=Paraburkholderia TaxID=1822464 RepID=UPI002255D96F|nr:MULTISPECIES: glycosyltransferase family 4 protein [Paraburkholderia]MCX4165470.1 glycosyltransferase family 4 protein [Paraburkholderia megapolitana]MDN7160961.1 glycosyltransferase family 4 protein [Paraburkholderia sp. CHISQ3]MDQ6498008.1 glycosyltransferase family 4 protein [Paraburkholderia megapolitana]
MNQPQPAGSASAQALTVLFVDQSGQLGGAEFALLSLAGLYASRGKVVLLSEGPFRARLEALGVHVQVIGSKQVSNIHRQSMRFGWLRALPGIASQVRAIAAEAKRFDVLFLNTQKALVLGALGKPFHRRPVIWYLHDIMSAQHFGFVQRAIVKWMVCHMVDRVVANSHASAQALAALTGCATDTLAVVHNGIDTSIFDSFGTLDADDIAALRRRLGLPEHVWLAGLFGRIAPWKGQHVAIAALARLQDVHLVLVGDALYGEHAYAHELHDLAKRIGVTERVHFVGFRDEIPAWMKAMDVILHTSTEPEPFGRVIVEGMAAAKPVIATAAGGVTEIIRHQHNGWLVQPGDEKELADAVSTLRASPDLAQRLADQGHADAQRDFSLDGFLRKMTQEIANTARR